MTQHARTRGNPTPNPNTYPAAASRISAGYQTITCTSASQSTRNAPAAFPLRSSRRAAVSPWNASLMAPRRGRGSRTPRRRRQGSPATVTATPVQVPPPGGPRCTIVRLEGAGHRPLRRADGVRGSRSSVRLQRARASHRRADDARAPRQASPGIRGQGQRRPRGHRVGGQGRQRGPEEPRPAWATRRRPFATTAAGTTTTRCSGRS